MDFTSSGFAERLKASINGESVNSAAKRCGFSEGLMRRYLDGTSVPGVDKGTIMARTLNVSLEWLLTGYGSKHSKSVATLQDHDQAEFKRNGRLPIPAEAREAYDEVNMLGYVSVPVMDITASAGGGSLALQEGQVGTVKFDRNWLFTTYNVSPVDLFTLPSTGDSMEPTIKAGEFLLASRAEHHTKPGDGIYIIRLEGDILVKRLQRLPGGKIRISSDNHNYHTFEIQMDHGLDLKILGKVVLVHGIRPV